MNVTTKITDAQMQLNYRRGGSFIVDTIFTNKERLGFEKYGHWTLNKYYEFGSRQTEYHLEADAYTPLYYTGGI